MTESRSDIPSITDKTPPLKAGESVVGVHFLGDRAVFVTGEEALLFVAPDGGEQRVAMHAGGILASAGNGERVVTGGDDGKVIATNAAGETRIIASDEKKRWIDHVALGPDGAVAWSVGKTAFVQNRKGEGRSLDLASTAGGLAFMPKGFRLAIAHYNGATLWFPNVQGKPETLDWKGSHLGITVSPDGKFIITPMQEPMLHGWRLMDGKHMRMSGYAARVRSMEWTAGGDFLATGGADQLILWPFQTKDGPMGKQPTLYAPHSARLNIVACHPKQPVVACGYADGLVLLVRVADGAEILAKRPGDAPISALGWSNAGTRLAFGCEDGEAGIVDLT
ncbi:MAG: WD40 repeat domain-containing protein [Pseudorhodoplanes sp.]|nr:WD40 repeat domain-containing protein [Pseudorhodoplanes sp.]